MSSPTAPVPTFVWELLRTQVRERRFSLGDVLATPSSFDGVSVFCDGQARLVSSEAGRSERTIARFEGKDVFAWSGVDADGRAGLVLRGSSSGMVLDIRRSVVDDLCETSPEFAVWLAGAIRNWSLGAWFRTQSRWSGLSEETLGLFVDHAIVQDFKAGDRLFSQGEKANALYGIRHGTVALERAIGGEIRCMAFLSRGDLLGATSLRRQKERLATARAVAPGTALVLGRDVVERLARSDQGFAQMLERHAQATEKLPSDFRAKAPPGIVWGPASKPMPVLGSTNEPPGATETSTSSSSPQEGPLAPGKARSLPVHKPEPKEGHPFRTVEDLFLTRKGIPASFSFVEQIDEMDCGAACLLMVLRHFGGKSSLTQIRSLCHVSTEGTSLANLCHAAMELGLAARALKVSKKNLPLLPVPAIVHWAMNHWVVLLEVTDKDVRLADPALGIHRVPIEEFHAKWSGSAAIFDFTPLFLEKNREREQEHARWYLPFLRPFRNTLVLAVGLALLEACLEMLHPVFTQIIVDRVVIEGARNILLTMLVAMAACFTVLVVSILVRSYLLAFVAQQVDAAALDEVTRRLLRLPLVYFMNRRTGDIQRRMDGVEAIRQALVNTGVGTAVAAVELTLVLLLMALYNFRLTALFLLTIPLYAGAAQWSSKVLRPLIMRLEESSGRYRSDQLDAIKGIEAVKVNAAEPWMRGGLVSRFLAVYKEALRVDFLDMVFGTGLRSVGFFIALAFLGLGAHDALEGRVSLGAFVAFSTLATQAMHPLDVLAGTWERLQKVRVHLDRIGDVVESSPEQPVDANKLVPVPALSGSVEFRGVSFRYGGPTSNWILKDVSLTIPAGARIAIVGRSGSGKTTFAKVMAGLLMPTEGTVLYDDRDHSQLNLRDLRRRLGFVLQADHIFSGTVLENIALGAEPQFDRAVDVARLAAAHDFISKLPLGYMTPIGEQGLALSGGQKQRVAIARALYRDPAILIFDEATSALDTESESLIQQNIGSILQGRTSIIIAHRLSTIRDADRIVVFEQGEIAEEGTHDELLERRGIYYQLVHRQVES